MMPELEERISASLNNQARRISASPDLAKQAYARARRLRRRRRVAGAVACVVALGIAVPVGYDLANVGDITGKTQITPVDTPAPDAPEPEPSERPEGPVTPEIDLDGLPRGDAPSVPWYADGILHSGQRNIPVEAPDEGSVQFLPVEDGYVTQTFCCWDGSDDTRATRLIGLDGEPKKEFPETASFPLVSADGTMLAWQEATPEGHGYYQMVAADAATGKERQRSEGSGKMVGFLGDKVVLAAELDEPNALWDPQTGARTEIDIKQEILATDDSRRLIVGNPSSSPEPCYEVLDVSVDGSRSERVWRTCKDQLQRFTTDGRYVVALRVDVGEEDTTETTVLLDASTGEEVFVFEGVMALNPTVEPDTGAVLVEMRQGSKTALVRCGLDGECELATEVRQSSGDGPASYLPVRSGSGGLGFS
ncbi:MAG TPA: hypothetical protein VIL34_03515 [Actinopolymorphaceae bacterium]|jgi:hypothetical protein